MSASSVRCFVAVLLPERVRAGLAAVSAELGEQTRGLSWVRAENLHLTLRFLGAVAPGTLEQVRGAVVEAATAVAPFTVGIGGLGAFPSPRAARVVWAGVTTGGDPLRALHAALEAALTARGIPEEGRAFHPHVTLGRARDRRGAAGLAGVLGAGPAFGDVEVTALHLMRSELHPRGARYSVVLAAALTNPSGVV